LDKAVVLTGVGRDRVGIVAELTDALFGLGCNLLDSSMTLLRGEFAIILMLSLPTDMTLKELAARVTDLEKRLGFTLHLRELSEAELVQVEEEGNGYIISVYGADEPGIVSGVTKKLADMGINITDVETKRTQPAAGGKNEPIFIMVLEVTAPSSVKTDQLTRDMKATAAQLGVDVSVQEWDILEL
jgi:glycine cleavage system transcriptional repressor